MSRILIVEDEEHLAAGLKFNLELEGYEVETADSAEKALDALCGGTAPFDLAVFDVMLPGEDGFTAVAKLRAAGKYTPVLMLTARGRAEDVIRGLEAGADDYLPKPFDLPILIARIGGLLRRRSWYQARPASGPDVAGNRFEFGGKTIDFDEQAIEYPDGRRQPLTLMETNLLRYLVRNEGRTVPRKALLEEVWGVREDTDTRAVDNFVVRLRRYVEAEPAAPRHLVTVRGVGYRFVAEPDN